MLKMKMELEQLEDFSRQWQNLHQWCADACRYLASIQPASDLLSAGLYSEGPAQRYDVAISPALLPPHLQRPYYCSMKAQWPRLTCRAKRKKPTHPTCCPCALAPHPRHCVQSMAGIPFSPHSIMALEATAKSFVAAGHHAKVQVSFTVAGPSFWQVFVSSQQPTASVHCAAPPSTNFILNLFAPD